MTLHHWKERVETQLPSQDLTWSVINQLRDLGIRPAHNTKVIFLRDPFNDFDTLFIARLVWNDPTIEIMLANHMPSAPTVEELESFDWILTFDTQDNMQKLRVMRSAFSNPRMIMKQGIVSNTR